MNSPDRRSKVPIFGLNVQGLRFRPEFEYVQEQAQKKNGVHDETPLEARFTVETPRYIARPPSTVKTAPVTYDAESLAKYATAPAMSSLVPVRPSGICLSIAARMSSLNADVMSVSI